ncbi:hypothetical protein NMY22_g10015 [Coprinellus aureogranulatus]|nr:hypothetical protein NMY22_g10015 [Coprinellus aureogranulatus]
MSRPFDSPQKNPSPSLDDTLDKTSTLPDEILAEIFSLGDLTITMDADSVQKARVMIAMQVCRRWRSIAVSTPALWSSLVIDLRALEGLHEGDSTELNHAFRTFTEMCLKRSAGHLLDMVIAHAPSIQNFPWLLSTSERWRSLDIGALELHTMSLCPSFKGFPALDSLQLHSIFNNCPSQGPQLDFPRLTTLGFPNGTGCLRRFPISVSTLTEIKIQVYYYAEIPTLSRHLSSVPNLNDLHLSTIRPHIYAIMRTPFNLAEDVSFRLPNLRKLHLESTASGAWEILSHCYFPSLTHLHIREFEGSSSVPPPNNAFGKILASFRGQLHSFRAEDMDISRFREVILQLKPRVVAISQYFPGPDEYLYSIIQDIVTGKLAYIEDFSLFDVSKSSAFISILVDSLQSVLATAMSDHGSPYSPQSPALRQINLHLRCRVPEDLHRRAFDTYVPNLDLSMETAQVAVFIGAPRPVALQMLPSIVGQGNVSRPEAFRGVAVHVTTGDLFYKRYGQSGLLEDLQDAISSWRKAVELTKEEDINYSVRCINLGAALLARAQRTMNPAHAQESVKFHREHPLFSAAFDARATFQDLNDSISNRQTCIAPGTTGLLAGSGRSPGARSLSWRLASSGSNKILFVMLRLKSGLGVLSSGNMTLFVWMSVIVVEEKERREGGGGSPKCRRAGATANGENVILGDSRNFLRVETSSFKFREHSAHVVPPIQSVHGFQKGQQHAAEPAGVRPTKALSLGFGVV